MQNLFGVGNFFIELQPNEKGSEQNEYNKVIKKFVHEDIDDELYELVID